jgi:hypothetical protein
LGLTARLWTVAFNGVAVVDVVVQVTSGLPSGAWRMSGWGERRWRRVAIAGNAEGHSPSHIRETFSVAPLILLPHGAPTTPGRARNKMSRAADQHRRGLWPDLAVR